MAKVSENRKGRQKPRADNAVESYIGGLDNEHKMLVVLKARLYGGSWEPMLEDLKNRLEGKPYIFKLNNRIKEDVERIEEMRAFEAENYVDLAEHVKLD